MKAQKWSYTLNKKRLFSFKLDQITDGILLTIIHPKIGDVHLTTIKKDGRYSWHVKDLTYGSDAPKKKVLPLGGQVSEDIFEKRIQGLTKRWIQRYNKNKCCWIMTNYLKSKISKYLSMDSKHTLQIPLEFIKGRVICDFENRRRWKRIRIIDILEIPFEQGYLLDGSIVKMIRPIDEKNMLCYSERQLMNFFKFILNSFGVIGYFEYLSEEKDVVKRNKRDML